ncbi:hypothetical protein HDV00_009356 [Rhizophlyctis rosea]|nr:hypothetical protein HDV00_009356 [Rhizophlyctis rosea]
MASDHEAMAYLPSVRSAAALKCAMNSINTREGSEAFDRCMGPASCNILDAQQVDQCVHLLATIQERVKTQGQTTYRQVPNSRDTTKKIKRKHSMHGKIKKGDEVTSHKKQKKAK